ncbi:MAG TPA: ferredoxin [Acidimicrobiales bacterium]|nr:ferredoxin [Acidimicrobiales bacterium]
MRISLDRTRCTGHGRCYTVAPEVFDADADGYGVLRAAEVAPGDGAPARRGAANCPEDAISLEE